MVRRFCCLLLFLTFLGEGFLLAQEGQSIQVETSVNLPVNEGGKLKAYHPPDPVKVERGVDLLWGFFVLLMVGFALVLLAIFLFWRPRSSHFMKTNFSSLRSRGKKIRYHDVDV